MGPPLRNAWPVAGAAALLVASASAQDLEPRRWTHLPTDLNVLGISYARSDVDIFLDPVLQIEDATADLQTGAVSLVRTFAVAGRSARVDVLVPYVEGEWRGLLEGAPATTQRSGFADPRIRLSVNFVGAPPLDRAEFAAYSAANPVTTTVGAALAITLPLGEYDRDRLINLGQNRFRFRPQLGVLHTRGPWSFELTGSVILFTDNGEFFGDTTQQRDPVYAMQTHVTRTLGRGWFLSAGLGWGLGGETEVEGVNQDNHLGEFLAGASLGMPLTDRQTLKLAYVRVNNSEFVGSDSDRVAFGWSVRF